MKCSFCTPPISISILFGLMSDMTEGNVALSSIDNHTRRKTTNMGYEAGIGEARGEYGEIFDGEKYG